MQPASAATIDGERGDGDPQGPRHTASEPHIPEGEGPGSVPILARRTVRTRLGGLFFLINLGLYLELYSDFTAPLSPGIDLSIWDFVTLVGRALLPGADTEDPVWMLLAELAGRRDGEAPGAGFVPPREWRVPASWLLPFEAGEGETWEQRTEGTGHTVWHPAGFCVLDVGGPARTLEWWLGRLMPYVRARLLRALAPDEGVDPAELLCEVDATVRVAEARLDVEMSLAELPIEVRLSGLDRDPGWVPAAGRHVAFHFEA